MKHNSGKLRTVMLMIGASVLVIAAIFLFALTGTRNTRGEGIVLPSADYIPSNSANASDASAFVTVMPDNVAEVVQDMHRPEAYHQILLVSDLSDGYRRQKTVEIWAGRDCAKVTTDYGGQKRHVLTDGETAYLWYQDEPGNIRTVTVAEDMTLDDIVGIPTYESVCRLPVEDITAAEYLYLAELGDFPCLYVCCANGDIADEFWIDLRSGLLCKASSSQNSEVFLEVGQRELVVLNEEDETLLSHLALPDGSSPFTASKRMLPEQ